jgi:hypothetical protein
MAGSVATVASVARVARAERQAVPIGRPRLLIHILLQGGIDAILTTDPKRKGEVGAKIDLPYEESEISVVGGTAIGPLLTPLKAYVPEMAILNGVVGSTVAHKTGSRQVYQMRRHGPLGTLGLSGTIGALRKEDAPLADVRFLPPGIDSTRGDWIEPAGGRTLTINHDADMDRGVLFQLSGIARDEMRGRTMATALAGERARCGSGEACMPLEVVHSLLSRMRDLPLPAPETVPQNTPFRLSKRMYSGMVRDTLFLLEHRLASAVFLFTPNTFDTHKANLTDQTSNLSVTSEVLGYLFEQLRRRRTPDGVLLADQVGIVISSELGRFPIKNQFDGKDHFPEFPVILMGKGIRPGQYGQTDASMISTPISVATGRPGSGVNAIIPSIDDVGATILSWFGIEDAASLGYLGRRLDFLLA